MAISAEVDDDGFEWVTVNRGRGDDDIAEWAGVAEFHGPWKGSS